MKTGPQGDTGPPRPPGPSGDATTAINPMEPLVPEEEQRIRDEVQCQAQYLKQQMDLEKQKEAEHVQLEHDNKHREQQKRFVPPSSTSAATIPIVESTASRAGVGSGYAFLDWVPTTPKLAISSPPTPSTSAYPPTQYKRRQCNNEQRERQRLERVKRFEEQEIACQHYETGQQRLCNKQEIEFACRRCPEKFLSNNKLHKHIVAHHTKPPLSALAMPPFSSYVLASLAPTAILQATFSAPKTPPASTSATPKLSYAAIAGSRTPPTTPTTSKIPLSSPALAASASSHAPLTPPTTPKIAKPTCAMPKPAAYMTMDDLFRKFAPRDPQLPRRPAVDRPQSLQMPPPILPKATVACSHATLSAFNKRARSSKLASSSISTRVAVACRAIPTWEWTKQFGLQLRAWVI
ncbi:hypothetical protein MMC22_011637 [Lobaria immixta]|nr:hypothetical protein [Lobaria immixta]